MIDNPETYLTMSSFRIVLVCRRDECLIQEWNNDGTELNQIYYWSHEMPDQFIPEEAVMIRAKHVATHTKDLD